MHVGTGQSVATAAAIARPRSIVGVVVTFVEADGHPNDEVDASYRAKYRRYAERILDSVLTPEARSTTMKLVPR
ncbi:MAG: DUF2255 family protein [Candidatus Dormiibacterota bacterium]